MTRKPRVVDAGSAPSGHTMFGRVLYAILWGLSRIFGVTTLGVRVRFAEPLPLKGGLLVLSTHQSHLDPLLLGLASDRRLSSLARSSLFHSRVFGAIISALDAVPIDRNASMVAAIKAVIGRLKAGGAVTIFPEGSRTPTGKLTQLKPGFTVIAKRAGVPIMPVAIVGAYECWPRTRLLPRPGRIRLEFGPLITVEDVARLNERELFEECVRRIEVCDARARAARDP